MSIGLQPVIFIVSLFLSSFWDFFYKDSKVRFKKLLLTHVVTAILVAPFYIKMYLFAQSAHKYRPVTFQNIISYVESFDVTHFLEFFFKNFYKQLSFFFILLLSILIFICIVQKKIPKEIIKITTAILAFPILFDFFFRIYVNWNYNSWYVITFSLFIILFLILILNELFLFLKNKKWKNIVIASLMGVFLWNTYDQIYFIKKGSQFNFPYQANDVEKVYDYLKEHGDSKDLAIEVVFNHLPVYRTNHLALSQLFFYKPEIHPRLVIHGIKVANNPPYFYEKDEDTIYYIDWNKVLEKENQKIFFIASDDCIKKDEENQAPSVLSRFYEGKKIGRFSIFEWNLQNKDREKQYKIFLSELIKKIDPKYSASLYETLLFYACKNKEDKKFDALLNKYRALKSSLKEFVTDMNMPAHFVLERRIEIFKRKKYCHYKLK
ncbi:MAG: hypothetical protein OXB84_02540 [Halobacteriovoraceae bacterium]|nr:hypothetical protein [Halobacteriovoraceae bacterium]